MKACTSCFRINGDGAESCSDCGTRFVVCAEAKPLFPSNRDKEKLSGPVSTPRLASYVAMIHLAASVLAGIIAFVGGMGSALSDTYQGPSQVPEFFLVVLEAPVAAIYWFAISGHPQTHTGLLLFSLLVMAFIWSAGFGWVSAVLYKKYGK